MSIQLQHISKAYGEQTVVRDVNLEIQTGELFVLLGASGSGKSTLLRLIAGLLLPDAGRIRLNEVDVTPLPPQKRGTGFVFQNYSLFRHMTVAENIAFGLRIRRRDRTSINAKVDELLNLIELPGYGNRLPTEISGGQQQRVALARALAYEPNVLLLDEPFGALDVKIRVQLRQNLRAIQQTLGITTILVTHDQEEAFDIADRIGIIEGGTLLEVGTPAELYRRPNHLFTATFLGTTNVLAARRNGTAVHIGNARLPAPQNTDHLAGQPVQLLCRPEEVEILALPQNEAGLIGPGIVKAIAFAGPLVRVEVVLEESRGSVTALLTAAEARSLELTTDQTVWLHLRDYHLLPQPS